MKIKNDSSINIKVAIIGGGWYGCEVAKSIKIRKPESSVTIFEKNSDIFSGVSGTFGNRLHVGAHYPRSLVTRLFCHMGYEEFYQNYPELINEHSHSIYGLGISDAEGNPSKINQEEFARVCQEFGDANELVLDNKYPNLLYAADIKEPSLVMGDQLRNFFKKKLEKLEVNIRCNIIIAKIESSGNSLIIETSSGENLTFDHVINATGFQALLPKEPLGINIFYQACFALVYTQNQPSVQPFSFIVMDGKFPSLMPYDDRVDKNVPISKYVLTHASITLSEQCSSLKDAENIFVSMEASIQTSLKSKCENEVKRFYPNFENEFTYLTYMGVVLAKVQTPEDFRGALTFKAGNIIYFIPGKISNVFQASREVLSFINSENILREENYSYIEDGIFDRAKKSSIQQTFASTTTSFFRNNPSNEIISSSEIKQTPVFKK
ncbi:MAG: hypothetical protein RLY40_907 [Pseudomonadota bacterium]|jgi:hypothetical protein